MLLKHPNLFIFLVSPSYLLSLLLSPFSIYDLILVKVRGRFRSTRVRLQGWAVLQQAGRPAEQAWQGHFLRQPEVSLFWQEHESTNATIREVDISSLKESIVYRLRLR